MEESEKVHKFERAGLGKAPYKYLGVTEHKFKAAPGEPVKAGGSCDYCAMAIMYAVQLQGACGKRFKVGCECGLSVGGAGIEKRVASWQREHERGLRKARKAAKAEKCKVEYAALLAELAAMGEREGFAGMFAQSVGRQIKEGKVPSPRQMAVIEKLRAE